MPHRTDSHVVADIATNRVAAVFNKCGGACQTVEHDYGEDLFVQTKIGDRVDPHRLWVQVKGTRSITRYQKKDGNYNFRVSVDHAWRWIHSSELVVFVLYDIERDEGFWTLPVEEIGHWHLLLSSRKTIAIKIKLAAKLDEKAAETICWEARISYYLTRFTVAHYRSAEVVKRRLQNPGYLPDFRSKEPIVVFDFLNALGFIDDDHFDLVFHKQFKGAKRGMRKEDPEASDRTIVLRAFLLAFLGFTARMTHGCAIPELLLRGSANYGLDIMAHFDSSTFEVPDCA